MQGLKFNYRRFKKNSSLRRYATPRIVRKVKNIETNVGIIKRYFIKVQHQTKFRAICHFGMQKTGSVWFREMLSDTKFYQYSGLPFIDCAGKSHDFKIERGIYAPIRAVNEETLKLLTIPDVAKIIVIRNPLSLLISWVNSTANYHVAGGQDFGLLKRREKLSKLDFEDKIIFALEYFQSQNRFQKTADVLSLAKNNPSATVIRYEDCLSQPNETFEKLLRAIDVRIPSEELNTFLDEHSFASYSGRSMGSKAPVHSALQGRTNFIATELSKELKSRIMSEVPCTLSDFYEG